MSRSKSALKEVRAAEEVHFQVDANQVAAMDAAQRREYDRLWQNSGLKMKATAG